MPKSLLWIWVNVCVGSCLLFFQVQFASFSPCPDLFCLFCSARSSEKFLIWITLTAPFCLRLWLLYLALTWWTSLSITLCPTRKMLARYEDLRVRKQCETLSWDIQGGAGKKKGRQGAWTLSVLPARFCSRVSFLCFVWIDSWDDSVRKLSAAGMHRQ